MKKILTLLIVIAAALSASAQFRYGPAAGITLNNLSFKQKLTPVSKTVGYAGGIMGEMMFPGIGFGLDLGLLYNQQGANVDLGSRKIWSSLGYGKEAVALHTFQIPFHLKFKYTRLDGFEDKVAPFVYGGPDFTVQFAGSNDSAFKRSGGDLGLSTGAGAEIYKNWQVSLGYTWGMTYALKTKLLDDNSARSRQWTLRAAYLF